MGNRDSLVYVVDDDASIRSSLSVLLQASGFKSESFVCAADFLAFKHSRNSSCLLLDVRLPGLTGPALQEVMSERGLAIPIVFITGHGSIPLSVKAMKRGAVDFLPKPFSEKDLLNAVERALEKSKVQNKEGAEVEQIKRRMKTLSPRELEVFQFVAKGMLNKQIASRRGTALQTIKVHRGRVMQKMQAKTVTELIHFAQKIGLVAA